MQQSTSDTMRKLMRLVVTDGYGKPADVPGYFVGGKTGTAEKVGAQRLQEAHQRQRLHERVPDERAALRGLFHARRAAGNKSTGGYSTAGAVSAPGAGRVIARIAPMLGLLPDTAGQAGDRPGAVHPAAAGAPAACARWARARRPRRSSIVRPEPERRSPPRRSACIHARPSRRSAAMFRALRHEAAPTSPSPPTRRPRRSSLMLCAAPDRVPRPQRLARSLALRRGAGDHRAHRRQPPRRARLSVRRPARRAGGRPRLHRRRGGARRRRGAGAARHALAAPACRRAR